MDQVFAQWRVRSNTLGKRFVHLKLREDPLVAYGQLMRYAPTVLGVRTSAHNGLTQGDRVQFHALLRHGGFTYQPQTGEEPKEGYSVGVHPSHGGTCHIHQITDVLPEDLAEHRRAARHLLRYGSAGHPVYQGGWVDRKTGAVYLDTSHAVPEEQTARDLGVHHRQLAYYDLARDKEIYFDPRRDPHFMGEGSEQDRADADQEYQRVARQFHEVTPKGYWGYERDEFGPRPGEEEGKEHYQQVSAVMARTALWWENTGGLDG